MCPNKWYLYTIITEYHKLFDFPNVDDKLKHVGLHCSYFILEIALTEAMPKSRKKKVKHQDFAKVKLKVGKKLPRQQNETDASFRSRTIQLRDQFQPDDGTPVPHTSKKKLRLEVCTIICYEIVLQNMIP